MSFKNTLVIINPTARHGETGPLVPAIEELLESTVPHKTVLTERPGHAAELAKDASGYDLIIAVGGDGTAHEVLNGIMSRPADDRPAMSLFPTGSGNDWRRTLGISTDLATAVRQVLTGRRKRVDVGVCNGIYFANSLAIGLDARVTAKAVELKITTGWSGLPLYFRALMYVLFRQYYSHKVRVRFDDSPVADRDILIMALTNGPTYGGGFFITPKAIDDDGLLDVCTIDAISLPSALWRLPFVITGKHAWMSMVHMERHALAELWSEVPVAGQVDGEVLLDDHYEISIIPGGLEVIVPRSE